MSHFLRFISNQAIPLLATFSVGLFMLALIRYGSFPSYIDHSEPATVFRAWLTLQGHELYRTHDAYDYLLSPYGPLTYLLNGLVMLIKGGSLFNSKLTSLSSSLLSIGFFIAFVWRAYGRKFAGPAMLLMCCFLLLGLPHTIWVRPDPVMVMLVSFALFSTTFGKGKENKKPSAWLTAVIIATCVGLAVNFKAHAFLFFIPIVIGYCTVNRLIVWPAMVVISLIVFALPFVLSNIDFGPYQYDMLKMADVHPVAFELLLPSLRYTLVFISPIAVFTVAWWIDRGGMTTIDIQYIIGFLGCISVGLYFTIIPGTYWYHLIPFFPVTLDIFFRFSNRLQTKGNVQASIISVFALTFIILSITPQKRFHRVISDRVAKAESVMQEVTDIIEANPDTPMELGYGDNVTATYNLSFIRPLLAFAGNDTIVAGHSDMEAAYWRKQPSEAKIKYLKSCAAKIWLIPVDEEPFALANFYQDNLGTTVKKRWVYSSGFREAFLSSYQKTKSRQYFDIWNCRKD